MRYTDSNQSVSITICDKYNGYVEKHIYNLSAGEKYIYDKLIEHLKFCNVTEENMPIDLIHLAKYNSENYQVEVIFLSIKLKSHINHK
jgi:hypothetical protein